jgi:hypothetical protein
MVSAGGALRIEWLKINDRKDKNCGDCTNPPIMKLMRNGVPRAYLCEEHGRQAAEREILPFPEHPMLTLSPD